MGFIKSNQNNQEFNYLELTPVRNLGYLENENGLIDILVPKFKGKFLGKFLQSKLKDKYIKANLDKFGSATWLLIDGNNKVRDIANNLLNQFGEEIQPVNNRLTVFMTQLKRNGFIYFLELTKGN